MRIDRVNELIRVRIIIIYVSLFEYYCFQTRTNASTGRATCLLIALTRWAASLVRVFRDMSATDFTVKVLYYFISIHWHDARNYGQ